MWGRAPLLLPASRGLTMAVACMQDGWVLNRKKVINYLLRVEAEYRPNSYHNNTHASDVTQTAVVILESFKQQVKQISKLEYFSMIIAAAVHDLGHLGVNNDFLINSRHPRATTYNDKSVNENFHISRAFAIAREAPDFDIFDVFSVDEQKQVGLGMSLLTSYMRRPAVCAPAADPSHGAPARCPLADPEAHGGVGAGDGHGGAL